MGYFGLLRHWSSKKVNLLRRLGTLLKCRINRHDRRWYDPLLTVGVLAYHAIFHTLGFLLLFQLHLSEIKGLFCLARICLNRSMGRLI